MDEAGTSRRVVFGIERLTGFGQRDFGQRFDDLVAESGDVFGSAAGDEVTVLDDLFVDPLGSGVLEVGVDRGPRGDGLALDDVGFDQAPGAVADGRYGFSGFDEVPDEGYRVFVGAKLVGVNLAAGEDESVVVAEVDFAHKMVDLDGFAPVGPVPSPDLPALDGKDVNSCSSFLEISFWVGEFDLLIAVSG